MLEEVLFAFALYTFWAAGWLVTLCLLNCLLTSSYMVMLAWELASLCPIGVDVCLGCLPGCYNIEILRCLQSEAADSYRPPLSPRKYVMEADCRRRKGLTRDMGS